MFGEFILLGGITLVSACVSKTLENKGKNNQANVLDTTTKTGFLIFAAKKLNDLFKEFTDL